MRKILTIICLLMLCVSGLQAEIHILPNGHFRIWKTEQPVPAAVDTLAAMTVCDSWVRNVFSGSVNFETMGRVKITPTVVVDSARYRLYALGLKGWNGVTFKSGNSIVFSHGKDELDSPYYRPFIFEVNMKCPEIFTDSDERLKSDIRPLSTTVADIVSLSPVSYRLRDGGENAPVQFGFLAQEVREIYPDLVYEDEDGILSIDYTGFIPLLVDAVKTLRMQVAEREALLVSLVEETGLAVEK